MAVKELRLCMGCMSPLSENGRCNVCGYDEKAHANPNYLPPNSLLEERYIVGRLSSFNPEGAWYVGYDQKEQLRVWIREYAPLAIAKRSTENYSVIPYEKSQAQYKALMADFEDLCHTIKELPEGEKIIPIVDILRANNTVYAIYRYIKTITLESFLQRGGGKLSWRHTKKLMMPLYHTVASVHKAGLIHRGLSPKTIHLDQGGTLWLGGLCIAAARTNKSELSAQLFSGFAAPEQYHLNSWQGTWTDVYALGALTYRILTGKEPPSAQDRVYGDDLLEEGMSFCDDMTASNIQAINKALAVEVEDRTQTAEMLIADLLADEGSDTAVYTAVRRPSYSEYHGSAYKNDMSNSDKTMMLPTDTQKDERRGEYKDKRKNHSIKEHMKDRKQRGKPFILLLLSMLVATLLLGGGAYWFAVTYLGDLFSNGENSSATSGTDFSQSGFESTGKLPLFIGTTLSSIQSNEILQKKYDFTIEEQYNSEFETGVVFEQRPVEGSKVIEGGSVTLFVSKGVEMVNMPDISGSDIGDAIKKLEDMGIKYQVMEKYNNSAKSGVVINTNPPADVPVDKSKDVVILFIKLGSGASSSDESLAVEESYEEEVTQTSDLLESSSMKESSSSSKREGVNVSSSTSSSSGKITKPPRKPKA